MARSDHVTWQSHRERIGSRRIIASTLYRKREAIPKRRVTQSRYRSWIKNHIKPQWANVPLAKVKPLAVEKGIESLRLAPKSRGHVRSLMLGGLILALTIVALDYALLRMLRHIATVLYLEIQFSTSLLSL